MSEAPKQANCQTVQVEALVRLANPRPTLT